MKFSLIAISISSFLHSSILNASEFNLSDPMTKGECPVVSWDGRLEEGAYTSQYVVNRDHEISIYVIKKSTGNRNELKNLPFVGVDNYGALVYSYGNEWTVKVNNEIKAIGILGENSDAPMLLKSCRSMKAHICEYENLPNGAIQFYLDDNEFGYPQRDIDGYRTTIQNMNFMTDNDCDRFGLTKRGR